MPDILILEEGKGIILSRLNLENYKLYKDYRNSFGKFGAMGKECILS